MNRSRRLLRLTWLLLGLAPWSFAGAADSWLARDGRAEADIVVAPDATAPELLAARELAHYLERSTGASFPILLQERDGRAAVHVGWTAPLLALDPQAAELAPEAWVLRRRGRRLFLYGGRPRGTLYAVFRYLEDELGVRWWTPLEETVPRRRRLRLATPDRAGEPAFAYRDIHLIPRGNKFCLRNRLNGHFTSLSQDWGGSVRYGEPWHVHTFHHYVSPAEWFDQRPELFSEVAGVRYGGDTQLCLSHPDLLDLVSDKMEEYVQLTATESRRFGLDEGRVYGFSPMDVGRPCTCDGCRKLVERHGTRGGPLMRFVNDLARRMDERSPGIVIDTLAYGHTAKPPTDLEFEPNVIVRLAGLYERNFARSILHESNREYRRLVEQWAALVPQLQIWDYTSIYALHGELPVPNLRALGEDYRFYLDQGVKGLFIQHEFPIAADMRDLTLWLLTKWLEDPSRGYDALVEEFTDGYYGRGGRWVRRYLSRLEKAAARTDAVIECRAPAEAYEYLDTGFLVEAHRLFDRAERAVRGEPVLLRRLRHARLSLDRASLILGERLPGAGRLGPLPGAPSLEQIAERYRGTWRTEIQRRYLLEHRAVAREEVDREIDYWLGRARKPRSD